MLSIAYIKSLISVILSTLPLSTPPPPPVIREWIRATDDDIGKLHTMEDLANSSSSAAAQVNAIVYVM